MGWKRVTKQPHGILKENKGQYNDNQGQGLHYKGLKGKMKDKKIKKNGEIDPMQSLKNNTDEH